MMGSVTVLEEGTSTVAQTKAERSSKILSVGVEIQGGPLGEKRAWCGANDVSKRDQGVELGDESFSASAE